MKTLSKIKSFFFKQKYYCRDCGHEFNVWYMAEICHDLDLKVEANEKKKLLNVNSN